MSHVVRAWDNLILPEGWADILAPRAPDVLILPEGWADILAPPPQIHEQRPLILPDGVINAARSQCQRENHALHCLLYNDDDDDDCDFD
jgi:hypothetical protein